MIFRAELALALVSRGDEFLTRGDVVLARQYYLRAIRLDPDLGPAVDRFIFFGIEQRTPAALDAGASLATIYLLRHPHDGVIRADRALCYQILKEYRAAARDFVLAAVQLHSAKYYTFAGWAQYRLGDRRSARRLWTTALHMQGSYSPAAGALRRVGR